MTTTNKLISGFVFPELPLADWESTKDTLHLFIQVVGKIKLALMPKRNHWWHIPLYVTSKGLTTSPIPYQHRTFEIQFDLIDHEVCIEVSDGEIKDFPIHHGLSVADFYEQLFEALRSSGIYVKISGRPYENKSKEPFITDSKHACYQKEYVTKFWQILVQTDSIFKEFSGRFYGKICPVQLYWHSFDLVVTRFSGKRAPEMKEGSRVDREAYSHEVISFGFWPGDDTFREPAFYSYTYPSPQNLSAMPLLPENALWVTRNNSPLAIFKYHDMILSEDPKASLLSFLESAYIAGATTAKWPVNEFKTNFENTISS